MKNTEAGVRPQNGELPNLPPGKSSRLWLWVVAACLVQIAVWTGWITLASKHPVQEVPVGTAAK